jgi:hypothetical protein
MKASASAVQDWEALRLAIVEMKLSFNLDLLHRPGSR